jgi:hypothetical protein
LIYEIITIQAGFMVKETTIEKGKYSIIICYILFLIYSKLHWIRAGKVFVNISKAQDDDVGDGTEVAVSHDEIL